MSRVAAESDACGRIGPEYKTHKGIRGVEGEGPGMDPLKAAVTMGGGPISGEQTAQAMPLLEPPE
jgi:hypothetical protein